MRASLFAQAESARLRAGRPARAPADASALRPEVPCAARPPRAAPPLGLAWPARRCASRLCSDLDMLAVAPPLGRRRDAPRRAALLGVVHARPGLPTRSLAATTAARVSTYASVHRQGRGWVCDDSDICGAEERRARGRARSALRVLTRRDCSSTANAVSGASFATGHETEYRREPGAKRRAAAFERRRMPTRGFARSMVNRFRSK
jgi:hypothetical protein